MTTTLVIVLDPPPAALHDQDPIAWTAGYVRATLMEAGLVVHDCDQHPELVLDAARPPMPATPTDPDTYECPVPWCRAQFSQQHHVKMHMRSHTMQDCQWCHVAYKLTGLHSHERSCASNPANTDKADKAPLPKVRPFERADASGLRTRVPRRRRGAEPVEVVPIHHNLGPIERRPFDPDQVRAAAFAGSHERDGDPFA